MDVDDEGNKYLIIHSGSRNLGNKVAQFYQQKAIQYIQNKELDSKKLVSSPTMKERNKKAGHSSLPRDLCYLEGQDRQDYLYDMDICQRYANSNRLSIGKRILDF